MTANVGEVLLLLAALAGAAANSCYACSGTCHSEQCNCQMGSCQANQCYIERKPTEIPGVTRITKGCLRHPSRKHVGCEYDHFSDHVLCVCNGRFCNNEIQLRRTFARNITCRMCTEKDPDCDSRCIGHWCHEDSTTGTSGCGFGPPALPFFYKGPELFYYRNKVCITMSRGAGKPRRHCICNTDMCNNGNAQSIYRTERLQLSMIRERERENSLRSRSLAMSGPDHSLPVFTCINCELLSQDSSGSVTSSCKQNRCVGHYCTYASQRYFNRAGGRGTTMVSIKELQGCLNVSDSTNALQLQLGCSRKWIPDEHEDVRCACRGNLCNRDEVTAHAVGTNATFAVLLSFLLWRILALTG